MKILKKLLFALSMIFAVSIGISSVKAGTNDTTMVKDRFQNVHGIYDGTNRVHIFFGQRYLMNGDTAYCIEPAVAIDTDIYSSTEDWNVTNLSDEVKNYVRLVAYYGYDYPNHQTQNYYLAAQELIWEKITGRETYWVTEPRVDAPVINIDNEKNEILSLVNRHYLTPSFNENVIEVNLGENMTLTDKNGVLNGFEIYSTNLENVSINGNTLKVSADNKIGEYDIQLVKKSYTNKVTLIYHSGSNQKLASVGFVDPVISIVKIKTVGGTIKGTKLDRETGSTPQGDAILKGAKYGIYNSNNELVDTLVIGTYETSKKLPYGTYTIRELEASRGYELSSHVETVTIDANNQNVNINLYEDVIKKKYNFFKVFATNESTILKGEANVQFDIYLKSTNKLYKSFTTDENGYASIELPYGTYIVKQKTTTKDYNKVADFEIVVNEKGEENILLSNSEITARLKVIKIDKDTGNVIKRSNIKFRIKNVSTSEYVCQTISYPTAQTICEYSTDDNGILITPYPLGSGRYILEEVDQAIDGYLWNKESIEFYIGENAEFITDSKYGILFEVEFENKQVKGQVEVTKIGEELVIENNSYHYEEIKLSNVTYELYASADIISGDGTKIYSKGDLIGIYTTDNNGYLKIDNLYLGSYYLVEVSTDGSHVLDDSKHYFTLNYVDQYTPVVSLDFTFKNYMRKGTLEFTKTDVVTSEPLPNTKIQIFDEETDTLIFEGVTDENGKIIITDLYIGKFYLIESEAPDGYQLNPDKMHFEIKENGEIVKADMTDEQIVKVPNTSLSDSKVLEIIGLIFIVAGAGYIFYDQNKKNK